MSGEEKMKQKIFVILIILFFAIFTVRIYSAVMTAQCEETVLPDSIAPKEIIYLLETYWNSGNEKGISMICSESYNIAVTDKPYSFEEDVLRRDVHISECEEMPLDEIYYPKLYDKHCYKVCWNYEESYEIDWRSGGFAFILIAKESDDENAPYKICAMFTGL